MTTETLTDSKWSERDWDRLLDDIRDGAVIPVVGEELYTVAGPDGAEQPLYLAAAQKLAVQLGLEMSPGWEQNRPLNEVMCAYLRDEKQRGEEPEMGRIYDRFCDLFRALNPQPSAALKMLAEIRDFRLLVTTTSDDLLERALDQARFGGTPGTTALAFMLKPPYEDLRGEYDPASAGPSDPPVVYHLFGRLNKRLPDQFVLSDDDLLEFFLAIQSLRKEELPNLRDALEENHLLFLGGSLSDWLVRFLLRTANRDHRLSERPHYDVLAATAASRESDLVKFLKFFSPRTKLAPSGPRDFVMELHRRWTAADPEAARAAQAVLPRVEPPDRMPDGCVFISYASEDREAVRTLKAHLDAAGIPVWFDRDQLMSGHNWDMEIQNNLNDCSFFIPIISPKTQQILRNAYFRKEWYLADQIAKSSYAAVEFILPVLLEDMRETLAVPESFTQHQGIVAPRGEPPQEFVKRLKGLVEQRKANPLRR
ncbi:MAG TPA: TIR domain-containing protein [Candidatus Aquilonibacter sp.]|nr:TIR domain-containing protein [Candidatus Aquilonibacter sp.]